MPTTMGEVIDQWQSKKKEYIPSLQKVLLPGMWTYLTLDSAFLEHYVECGVIKSMIRNSTDLKRKEFYEKLHYIATNLGHSSDLQLLLIAGVRPDVLLHRAVCDGCVESVKILLEADADPMYLDKYDDTPLHDAARHGHLEIAQLLLDAGASIDAVNEAGETPLDLAMQRGQQEMEYLLRYKTQIPCDLEERIEPSEKQEDF